MTTAFIISVIIILALLIAYLWSRAEESRLYEDIRYLQRQLIEFGMHHNQSMVHYSSEARKNRQLIKKYNALHRVVWEDIQGLSSHDRAEWLKRKGIEDFVAEGSVDSCEKVVDQNRKSCDDRVANLKFHEQTNKK